MARRGFATLLTRQFASDLYVNPLVLQPATFAYASLVVLGATAVSCCSSAEGSTGWTSSRS